MEKKIFKVPEITIIEILSDEIISTSSSSSYSKWEEDPDSQSFGPIFH